MTRRWWIAGICSVLVVILVLEWVSYDIGRVSGYADGVRAGRADADRRVRVARAECHDLLANQRAWYEGLHDRASVIWETNTRALIHDMMIYEHDLERCHGRR
jgi:hypothetical protein